MRNRNRVSDRGLRAALTVALAVAALSVAPLARADDRADEQRSVSLVIAKFKESHPGLASAFEDAYGYAVFPPVGKGGMGLGAARGKGYVYEHGRLIGRSTLTQVTIGLQLGGQAYSEVVFFKDKDALAGFRRGRTRLDGQASAIALDARAAKDLAYSRGVAVATLAKGGLMYEAAVGGQKFSFTPVEP